jgi:hypothetical protein
MESMSLPAPAGGSVLAPAAAALPLKSDCGGRGGALPLQAQRTQALRASWRTLLVAIDRQRKNN